jgi:hypothetical protein
MVRRELFEVPFRNEAFLAPSVRSNLSRLADFDLCEFEELRPDVLALGFVEVRIGDGTIGDV